MIDHVSLGVSDLETSAKFYDAVLGSLSMSRIVTRDTTIGYGKRYPEVWLNLRRGMPRVSDATGLHICLRARSEDAVRAFHSAALAHGGTDDGAPGPRVGAMTGYFGAFVRDPDGNKLEAATFPTA